MKAHTILAIFGTLWTITSVAFAFAGVDDYAIGCGIISSIYLCASYICHSINDKKR